ncbi:MAG: SagB/ThcOx family dehydrogenase [Chloroflexota bacterium]
MKLIGLSLIALLSLTACHAEPGPPDQQEQMQAPAQHEDTVALPEVRLKGEKTVETALFERRSIRNYTGESLELDEVAQLLWSAQGMTADWGGRTAPSAGATYPLELHLVAGDVDGLDSGVYRYASRAHRLVKTLDGDIREELAAASLGQSSVREGAAVFVFSAVYERTTGRYGDRGVRYVHMEAGHAAQNIYLQAVALDLGTVAVGAFSDDAVKELLSMSHDEVPLYVIPVGKVDVGSG